jgi:hypothetical protein
MDSTKPIDPHALEGSPRMISDQEMKRINLEASSNPAQLLQLWHEDEFRLLDLLQRATSGSLCLNVA